jgi:hypothetical protein
MVPSIVRFAVLAGAVILTPHLVEAQKSLGTSPIHSHARDSARAHVRARAAQAGFERYRYGRLPRTYKQAGIGECDEVIGRFCFSFDADPDTAPPPAEAPAIGARRQVLLNRLAGWGARFPGNGWIAGQRVRYLLEAGSEEQAIATARECGAEAWWCAALRGLALHEAQRFADAEAAFAEALAAMPQEERARWTDVSDLLAPPDQRLFRRASDADRAAWMRRLWWLADPLWSDTGNDRLTEHYARWTMHHVQQDARQVDRVRWRDDTREIVVRYGWFTAWKRYVPFVDEASDDRLIAYGDPRTWEWLAPLSAARDLRTLRGDEWPLAEWEWTATRYAPEYVARVVPLPHQLAVFPRPTGAVLVAGYELDADSLPAEPRVRAAAVAMVDADGPRTESPWQPTAAAGALMLDLPGPHPVVSLEVREDSTRLLARHRQAIQWNSDARLSDLLLLAHPDARPEDLEEAARLARGSERVRAGERVGVFWEMYALPEGDSMTVRVSLIGKRAGWVRRQLESIGIARGERPVRLGWKESGEGEEVAVRSLAVGMPAELRPGTYTLELSVSIPGRSTAVTRRTITVVEEDAPPPVDADTTSVDADTTSVDADTVPPANSDTQPQADSDTIG